MFSLVQLAEFDAAMILEARSVAVRNLDEENQLAVAATALQVPAIHFNFDWCHEPLMKRKFGAWDAHLPSEMSLVGFTQPSV
jgi:hypothetical protein